MTPTTRVSDRMLGWRAGAVWAVAIAAVVVVVGSLAIGGSSAMGGSSAIGSSGADATLGVVTLILAACVASFGLVGATVAIRLPRNAIGWILWVSAPVIAGSLLGTTYAAAGTTTAAPVAPAVMVGAILSKLGLFVLLATVGIFVPLLFPNGHLPSPRWRWVARGSAAAIAGAAALYLLMPGSLNGNAAIQNPLGLAAFDENPDAIGWIMSVVLLVPFASGVAAVVVRFRHGGPVERQQVKWFGGAVGVMVVSVFLGTSGVGPLGASSWILTFAGIALLPIAVGMAILRYRLYDIDRIISRTIAYLIVTGMLAVVFVGAVLVSRAVLGQFLGENPIEVAASTLIVAALFQPLRRRVQRVVDRRFNRSRYDAEQTVAAFSARLRDETDMEIVKTDLVETTGRTVAPRSLGVWLRAGGGGA